MTRSALQRELAKLSSAQKLKIVGDLWESIANDQESLPLSDAHAMIIDERLAADETDPGAVTSWSAVKKSARQAVARRRASTKKRS